MIWLSWEITACFMIERLRDKSYRYSHHLSSDLIFLMNGYDFGVKK